MELKVWVEGIQRIVCGVTVNTTCQDVVFALAHATGKVGRFTLIERWRNNERLLAPNENPLKLLLKWGEYANDVQFILQRSENKQQSSQQQPRANTNPNDNNNTIISNTNISNNENRNPQTQAVIMKKPLGLSNTNNSNTVNSTSHNNNNKNIEKKQNQYQQQQQQQKELNLQAASERTKELKKSFGAYDKHIENIGIVKGIPQQKQQMRLMNHNSNNINSNNTINNNNNNNNNITTNMIAKYSPTNNNVTIKSTTITATTAASFNSKHNSSSIPHIIPKHEKSHSNPIEMTNSNNNNSNNDFQQVTTTKSVSNVNNNCHNNNIYSQLGAHNSKSINEINLAEVRESLARRTVTPTPTSIPTIPTTSTIANISNKEIFYSNVTTNVNNNTSPAITTNTTTKYIKNNQFNSEENLLDIYSSNNIRFNNNNNNNKNSNNKTSNSPSIAIATNELSASPDLYKNTTPTISANGALVPPPYRNPPPPRNSPLQRMQTDTNNMSHSPAISSGSGSGSGSVSALGSGSVTLSHQASTTTTTTSASTFLNDYTNVYEDDFHLYATPIKTNSTNNNNIGNNINTKNNNGSMLEESESIFQATQYNDLLQLIKFQREKISAQQLELTKYDAEIIFLENKERDQAQELEAISREITKADQIFRQGSEQLQALQYVEEENELVKQQEKTLKSEIALLRSKLANCETELLQCKNKIRLLMDDIEIEQRALTQKQKSNRQNFERDFLMEMERIQNEIDQAIMNTDTSNKTAENLKKEIMLIEQAIAEKKRQVEKLVNEMKEVNLQSLQVTTSEEIKNLLEGPNKQGSSRRIIGSPRQLENAVPTSKNPHGVWV